MTRLQWNQLGERKYETGCDRGVLYLPTGSGVVWNGLTSVEEDFGDISVQGYWLDGVKYLNRRSPTDFSGTMKALTYPDEFEQFDGVDSFHNSMYATAQPVTEAFSLSYRTLVGADDRALGEEYKIHILYNVTALPDNRSYSSVTNVGSPEEFSWKLSATPVPVPNMRPSAHIIIKSSELTADMLEQLEDYLYGSDTTTSALPSPEELVTLYDKAWASPPDTILALITEPL